MLYFSRIFFYKSICIVYTDTFIEENPSEIQHIALGDWADAIIVAPATAKYFAAYAYFHTYAHSWQAQ
jgi:phosphopantothenoylcysteine synthetase/decarboxylase